MNTRICTGRADPRDMNGLKTYSQGSGTAQTPPRPCTLHLRLWKPVTDCSCCRTRGAIERAIEPEPPLSIAEGGVIRAGYNEELDSLRSLAFSGKAMDRGAAGKGTRADRDLLAQGGIQQRLRVLHRDHQHPPGASPDRIHPQTDTDERRALHHSRPEGIRREDPSCRGERILALETRLFNEVRAAVVGTQAEAIQTNAQPLAALDCYTSLAGVAAECEYVCPEVNESTVLEIEDGRHPVIERLLPPGEQFIPNDPSGWIPAANRS